MDRDRRQPQTRRDLAGRRAAPGSRSARPRLRDHAGAHCALSAGADMIEALVLTGFLGSGKTTLLGHLLRQPEFSRTAVIINEFGEIGLDHELVEASDDSFIALTTGCLCCKVRDELGPAIDDMLRRRE